MNAWFQYIHSSIDKYNLNLYIKLLQFNHIFYYAITRKERIVTRQIPETDTCPIPALLLRKPKPTTLEMHSLTTTLEFAQKKNTSLWKIMLESWKVQNSPTSVSRYLHVIPSIYWISVKAGLLHCNNSINNVVFSPNYMISTTCGSTTTCSTTLVEQIQITFLSPV